MHPMLILLIHTAFLVLRWAAHTLRDFIWWLNGTSQRLEVSRRTPALQGSAHVLDIVLKYKFDPLMQGNKLEDFLLLHNRFENADYVLQNTVSLYTVDQNRLVFVECPEGHIPWDINAYSFSKEGQFRQAMRVITLPVGAATALVHQMGDLHDKVVVLGNTSRCGSTLLCRMFQSTGCFCSYTEPGVLSDLMPYVGREEDIEVAGLIRTTMRLLCKPCQRRQGTESPTAVDGHIVKVSAQSTAILSSLYKLYPDWCYLFMYRNHLPVLKSLARISLARPYVSVLVFLEKRSGRLAEYYKQYHKNWLYSPDNPFSDQHQTPYTKVMSSSISALAAYYEFVRQGMQIFAIRFEDLIHDPHDSMRRVFLLCGVPEGCVTRSLRPLDHDAQDRSPITAQQLSKLDVPKFTEYDASRVGQLCQTLNIPDVMRQKVHPNTITYSGD